MEKQKIFLINEKQLNGVLNYLYTRPYGEVVQGVQVLENLPEAPEVPEPKEKESD